MKVAHRSTRRARTAAAVLATLLLAFGVLATAQSASAIDDGKTGIRPSTEADFIHLSVSPGAAAEATAVVSNDTAEPVTLLTYPVDAISSDAGFAMADIASPRVGVGDWVRLGADEITVPANSEVDVPFELRVPAGTPPGDYAGAIIIQSPPVRGATTTVDNTAVRMDVIQRQGLRIYLEVAGEAMPSLDHGGLAWSADADGGVFSVPVTNTGNTILRPTAELNLREWTGETSTLRFDAPESLLPGATLTLTARLPGSPLITAGDAEAVVRSEAGVDRSRATYAYAQVALIASVVTGLAVLTLAAWRVLRFLRRARAALAEVDRTAAPMDALPGPRAVPRSSLSQPPRAPRGRHAQPRRYRAT